MNTRMVLSEWKKRYPDEWLALRVVGRTPVGEPICYLLAHHYEEEELHHMLRDSGIEQAYIAFAGPAGALEYIVLFNDIAYN